MRTRFTVLLVFATAVGLVVVGPVAVSATASINVTGSYNTVSTIDEVVWHGESLSRTLYFSSHLTYSGVMEGTADDVEAVSHVHRGGDFAFTSIGTFVGCVDGFGCGTLQMRTQGTGGGPDAAWTARTVVLSGTGDLANVRGQGTLEGITGVGGTYSLNLHMDPAS